jgi:holo-[acyl-carrier protein] synthase
LASSSASPDPAVGIDLVEVDRIERALERRPRLAERLFTDAELEYSRSRRRPARHLAARFAAKEATIKALGAPVPPHQVEVEGGGRERPSLHLHGKAAELAHERGLDLDVSLTHTGELAAAVVIATSIT